jgi:thymidine phosphorylase
MTTGGTFIQCIEKAIRDFEEDDRKLLDTLRTLKDQINKLEQRVEEKKQHGDLDKLDSAIESLNQLTDSQILASKNAWKRYEEFVRECDGQSSKLDKLNELQSVCKKKERIAADLLCYSLGHLK